MDGKKKYLLHSRRMSELFQRGREEDKHTDTKEDSNEEAIFSKRSIWFPRTKKNANHDILPPHGSTPAVLYTERG